MIFEAFVTTKFSVTVNLPLVWMVLLPFNSAAFIVISDELFTVEFSLNLNVEFTVIG